MNPRYHAPARAPMPDVQYVRPRAMPPTPTGSLLLVLPRHAFREKPRGEVRISLDEFPVGNTIVRLQMWTAGRDGSMWPERERQLTIRASELAAVIEALTRAAAGLAVDADRGAR